MKSFYCVRTPTTRVNHSTTARKVCVVGYRYLQAKAMACPLTRQQMHDEKLAALPFEIATHHGLLTYDPRSDRLCKDLDDSGPAFRSIPVHGILKSKLQWLKYAIEDETEKLIVNVDGVQRFEQLERYLTTAAKINGVLNELGFRNICDVLSVCDIDRDDEEDEYANRFDNRHWGERE
jgi:hypothetical protein